MTRAVIGILISAMTLGSGLLMVLRPERFRDQQVIWWQSQRGIWAFRVLGAVLILLALWGMALFFKL